MRDNDTDPHLEGSAINQHWPLLLVLLISRVIAMIALPLYDDAFITFHSAENLANGHDLVFNVGEHIMGLTCPAFGVFQAGFALIGIPLHVGVPVINILLDLAIGLALILLLRRAKHGDRINTIALGFFIVAPSLARTTVGGMEMNLFFLLSITSIELFLKDQKRSSIMLASLTYFVRPEAVALVGVLIVTEFLLYERKHAFMLAGLSALTVAPGLILLQSLYGNFLPQSVVAKSTNSSTTPWKAVYLLLLNDPLQLVGLPLAVFGLIKSCRARYPLFFVLGWWLIAYVAAYALYHPFVWSWYGFAPKLIELVFAAVGLALLLGSRRARRLNDIATTARLRIVLSIIGAVVWGGVLIVAGPSKVTANIYRPMQALGKTIPAGATIMADDIGAIGYFTKAKIYDTYGLVWPAAVGKPLPQLIAQTKPDYIVLSASKGVRAVMDTSSFSRDYDLERMLLKDPRDTIQALKALGDDWVQEYLVYKRIP